MPFLITIQEQFTNTEFTATATKAVESVEIYTQRVELIDLPAIIAAVNKKPRKDKGSTRGAKTEVK